MYKDLRSFVLVLWMQRQCPVVYIREWNSLADSLISAAECAEDSVIRFMVTHPVIGGHQLSVQSEII